MPPPDDRHRRRRDHQGKAARNEGPDRRGRVAHEGGGSPLPGLYFLGLPFLRRRGSNLIAGVGDDAAELLPHLLAYLRGPGPFRAERRSSRSVVEGAGEQRVPDPMDHRIDRA